MAVTVKKLSERTWQAWCEECQDGVNDSKGKAGDWADGHEAWHLLEKDRMDRLAQIARLREVSGREQS